MGAITKACKLGHQKQPVYDKLGFIITTDKLVFIGGKLLNHILNE